VPDKGPSPSMIDSFGGPSFFAILQAEALRRGTTRAG
jgi:hypothetical protein